MEKLENKTKFQVDLELDHAYHVQVTVEALSFKDLDNVIEDKYGGTVKILNAEVL